MDELDPRLAAALAVQLERRRALLADGAERVGWKLGMGERERIGRGPVVGHLTSATRLEPGSTYAAQGDVDLRADVEVAVELARDLTIGRVATTLELVDLGDRRDGAETIVATNIFHRAFAFGSPQPALPPGPLEGRLVVNGQTRRAAEASEELGGRVGAAAGLLAAMGEPVKPGDWFITGSIVQVSVEPGDEIVAELDALGRVGLRIAS